MFEKMGERLGEYGGYAKGSSQWTSTVSSRNHVAKHSHEAKLWLSSKNRCITSFLMFMIRDI